MPLMPYDKTRPNELIQISKGSGKSMLKRKWWGDHMYEFQFLELMKNYSNHLNALAIQISTF